MMMALVRLPWQATIWLQVPISNSKISEDAMRSKSLYFKPILLSIYRVKEKDRIILKRANVWYKLPR